MKNKPIAWTRDEVLFNEASISTKSYLKLGSYSNWTPYDSYRNHTPYSPYTSYNFPNIASRDNESKRKTLFRKEYFGASICPPTGKPFKINHSAVDFLEDLPKNSTDSSGLEQFINNSSTIPKSDLLNFITKCVEFGWADAPFNFTPVGSNKPHNGILSAPYSVLLYPSVECNLEKICNKCYVPIDKFKGSILTPEEYIPLLSDLNDMGIFNLIILGGEPLYYPYLFELLEAAQEYPFITSLSTNALLIDNEIAESLSYLIDRIQVSLDGSTPETLELLKGKATFNPTIEGIKHLVRNGLTTIVSYVITKKNSSKDEIESFIKTMDRLGIHHISFIQYYPFGQRPSDDLMLNAYENEGINDILRSIRKQHKNMEISFEDSFGFLRDPAPLSGLSAIESTNFGCECGNTRISIYPNGDIIPCDFMAGINRFVVGNFHDDDLERLWSDSNVLNGLRNHDLSKINPCGTCEYGIICGGGCRAMAFNSSGQWNAPDSRCPLVNSEVVLQE